MTKRSDALAERLEQGALELEKFANGLTEAQWQTRGPKDTRKIGVVVHHVAIVYPLEIQLAQVVAAGSPVTDLTWDVIHKMNAKHSGEHDGVMKAEALDLLRRNSVEAAAVIRAMTSLRTTGFTASISFRCDPSQSQTALATLFQVLAALICTSMRLTRCRNRLITIH